MKGTLQKKIEYYCLACSTCESFRGDDPDIYYCELHREEFPALCELYTQTKRIAPQRSEWGKPE